MKNYLVSYSTEGTTAATVIYGVEHYEDLFPLAIRDFFDYEASVDDNGNTIMQSAAVLQEFFDTDDFYETCSNHGIYFGDIIALDEALQYVTTLAEFV